MNTLAIDIAKTTYAICLPLLLGYIGRQMSKITKSREDHIQANKILNEKIDSMTSRLSEYEMRSSRYRIIRFDDEMAHDVYHSDDHCDQILEDIDIYSSYCKQHPDFKNHKGAGAMNRILEADKKGELKGRKIS